MQHVDTIIKARWVIPVHGPQTILEHHAVVVHQGIILDIMPSHEVDALYQATDTRLLDRHALLPGFINAHTHVAMNLLRGLADDLKLMTWLREHIWPAESRAVSKEFVYDGSLHAMAEMIKGGTTCFNDMYFYAEETAAAAIKAGLRGFVANTVFNVSMPWSPDMTTCFNNATRALEAYKNHPLIKSTVAPHAPYTVDEDILKRVNSLAQTYQTRIHLHLHETQAEVDQHSAHYKQRPLAWLQQLGLAHESLLAVHMTALTDEEVLDCAKAKLHVVHCPESNMKLASGVCPVQKLLDAGVNVALGTDGAASNNDLDMIGEMRSAAFLAKISSRNPEDLPAYKVLEMATINGARALGIDQVTGSLAPDKAADIIAIDLVQLATTPVYNPITQIVYAATRDQVTDVWVAGKALMKARTLTTLNETHIMETAKTWQTKLSSANIS